MPSNQVSGNNKVWTHLTVQFDVFGKSGVDLSEGAAEAAAGDVDQIL